MMPKINVYLPDDLADAVKDAGVPVSAVCQRALELSVRRITAIRETTLNDLAEHDPTARLARFTERARTLVALGVARARADNAGEVGTAHLLHGMLDEGGNLGLQVLQAVEIDPEHVAGVLADRLPTGESGGAGHAWRFDAAAASALELAVTEAIGLGHNYVGCEHVLLGLLAEPDGTAGEVLRGLGADLRPMRGAVAAALAGFTHVTGSGSARAVQQALQPLTERIERIERHLNLSTSD